MEAWTIISLSMAAAACYGALVWLVTKHVDRSRPTVLASLFDALMRH